jgi:hypothetical protein
MLGAMRPCARTVRHTVGAPLRAIRKLEVTYSAKRCDYHPHLHLLVDGERAALALRDAWLSRFPAAVVAAQDVRSGTAGALPELFKYLSKLLVKIDGRYTAPPPRALDTLFKAVKGLRTVQPMGCRAARVVITDDDGALTLDASTPAISRRDELIEWEWVTAFSDWADFTTGELLAGYTPTEKTVQLLSNIRADAAAPKGGGLLSPGPEPPKPGGSFLFSCTG